MSGYKAAFHELRQQLQTLYDTGEATAIAREVLLDVTGLSYTSGIVRSEALSADQERRLQEIIRNLLTGKPMQYVLGYAWFLGHKFKVNEHTLIPRPETEELVDWILEDHKAQPAIRVLDIGTGTGCIAISLKLALDAASVRSCDISEGALAAASDNAATLGADVAFIHADFLRQSSMAAGTYDVIVSNPPYIPASEQKAMHTNVRDFEPGTALFVPDEDPQLFYRAIAVFGKAHLAAAGAVYCELHKDYATGSRDLFEAMGYQTDLRRDINGHWRMLKAVRKP